MLKFASCLLNNSKKSIYLQKLYQKKVNHYKLNIYILCLVNTLKG